jgi:hypothetical protein
MARLEGSGAAVDVVAERSVLRQVLRVRDASVGAEVALDPIELEGLTRAPEVRFEGVPGERAEVAAPSELQVLQNEFAMVQVGTVDTERGACLFIRDLASRAEICLDPAALAALTRLGHGEFAPLLDPSRLVQAEEPDPDQV